MKRKVLIIYVLLAGLLIFTGCEKDPVMRFDGDLSAVNFTSDSVSYSFAADSNDEETLELGLHIIGDSTNHNRSVEAKVLDDSLSTADPSDYEILGGNIDENKFSGYFRLKLYNSPKLDDERVSLHLEITESKDFKPGNVNGKKIRVYWTNQVVVPSDWTAYAYLFCKGRSTEAYRLILKTTSSLYTDLTYTKLFSADIGLTAGIIAATRFGNYIKEYNKNHPNNHLKHDDGPSAGQDIKPIHYSHSKYD